jgi:hypothetical protein
MKGIVGKLGQLAGALHRLGRAPGRARTFPGNRARHDVLIQHELGQRPVQARDIAAQHGKAAAGQFRAADSKSSATQTLRRSRHDRAA